MTDESPTCVTDLISQVEFYRENMIMNDVVLELCKEFQVGGWMDGFMEGWMDGWMD